MVIDRKATVLITLSANQSEKRNCFFRIECGQFRLVSGQ